MLAMRAGRLQRFISNPKLSAACCKMDCYALIGLLMRGGALRRNSASHYSIRRICGNWLYNCEMTHYNRNRTAADVSNSLLFGNAVICARLCVTDRKPKYSDGIEAR